MRMDPRGGVAADDVVNHWAEGDVRRLLHRYGEEPRAHRIARAIVTERPIATTTELADVVRQVVPTRDEAKTLSRVFQAIRIVVNAELERLEQALVAGTELVRPGGRMAVISYHSLEDRRVKRFFHYGNLEGEPVHDLYGNLLAPWRRITRKPVAPDEAEVEANPRSRSARLRIAERLDDAAFDNNP
jgi:16S rRNA (cytosine1402-N4)-methyltransferase